MRRRFDLDQVILVNDFGAVAWALPVLPPNALRAIGGGGARRDQPAVVLGPGTGLGVAASVFIDIGKFLETVLGNAGFDLSWQACH